MKPWSKIFSKHSDSFFFWKYDHYEGILIKIPLLHDNWDVVKYNITQVEKILNYIFVNEIVEINNNISKLNDGYEKSGLGTFLYNSFSDKLQIKYLLCLIEILLDLEILNSNENTSNLRIWLKNIDWKTRIEKNIDYGNTFPITKLEINHITFQVRNLEKSVSFYENLFDKSIIALGDKLAYFDLDGIWFALNEKDSPTYDSYDHIAFNIDDDQLLNLKIYFDNNGVQYDNGRLRSPEEGDSVYVKDPDNHMIEFHTKSLKDRLKYYSKSDSVKIFT